MGDSKLLESPKAVSGLSDNRYAPDIVHTDKNGKQYYICAKRLTLKEFVSMYHLSKEDISRLRKLIKKQTSFDYNVPSAVVVDDDLSYDDDMIDGILQRNPILSWLEQFPKLYKMLAVPYRKMKRRAKVCAK